MAGENGAVSAASIAEEALRLLEAAGYSSQAGDDSLMGIAALHTQQEIMNFCNLQAVVQDLLYCAARLAAAEFISCKKTFGRLEGFADLDLSPALKQLQEGDTNMVFDTTNTPSQEKKLDMWIAALNGCRSQLISFRKLRW